MSFGILPPKNITNLFENWLYRLDKRVKCQIRVGIYALLWQYGISEITTFLTSKKTLPFYMLSLFLSTGCVWLCFQLEEQRYDMDFGCSRLKTVALDLFSQCGW
jgi:hypothetical protein